MTHDEFKSAYEYWNKKDVDNVKMEREELTLEIEKYINSNNTCALATASEAFVRCTPIEYSYFDKSFFMFSEGGLKFKSLECNKNVCIAIFDKYEGFGRLKGMQITGTAEIIEPFSELYVKAANYKKIPIEVLKRLPNTMNLIRIKPVCIDFLNSDFKKRGYSSRQCLKIHY